jgi:hypothetical protein
MRWWLTVRIDSIMLALPLRKIKGLVMRRQGTPSVFRTPQNVAEKELAVLVVLAAVNKTAKQALEI